MSASEKLKALEGEWGDLGHDFAEGPAVIWRALPQIIAVVEAMHETCYAPTFGAVDEAGRIWKRDELQMLAIDKGRHALAALEAQL